MFSAEQITMGCVTISQSQNLTFSLFTRNNFSCFAMITQVATNRYGENKQRTKLHQRPFRLSALETKCIARENYTLT